MIHLKEKKGECVCVCVWEGKVVTKKNKKIKINKSFLGCRDHSHYPDTPKTTLKYSKAHKLGTIIHPLTPKQNLISFTNTYKLQMV